MANDEKAVKADETKADETKAAKTEEELRAEIRKEIEAEEEELRAEIRKEIEAEMAAKSKEQAKAAAVAKAAYDKENDPNRRVKIKLFKDNGKYKDPLFVSVNSYRAAIPRGVEVDVPYFVAKHIEEMLVQDQQTAELITMYTAEYEKNKSVLE